jgi:hypothetical protein
MTGLGRAVLILGLAAGIPASSASAPGPPPAELSALDSAYYTALLSGRDPDAAVRKARFTLGVLTRDLGMTPAAAAAYLATFVRRRSGTLCGG